MMNLSDSSGRRAGNSRALTAHAERLQLKRPFVIARGVFTYSDVVVAQIGSGPIIGHGECEPHESDFSQVAATLEQIAALSPQIEAGLSRADLLGVLPSGPARNAVDCALWGYEAKLSGRSAFALAGFDAPNPLTTVFTVVIAEPAAMAAEAAAMSDWRCLKLKLGDGDIDLDIARARAVRAARPDAEIIVDVNGGWDIAALERASSHMADLGVALIEQPLPPGADDALRGYDGPVPLCADESCTDRESLREVVGRYRCVNIKLDKSGGLTEALALAHEACALGLEIMVGCMTGTSLAMAPAFVVAQLARFVDLDGPLHLAADRPNGLTYQNGLVQPPSSVLWG